MRCTQVCANCITPRDEGEDEAPRSGRLFELTWARVIDSYDAHRPLWLASFEAFAAAQRSPELREQLADGQEEGRFGLAALFQGSTRAQWARDRHGRQARSTSRC